MRLTFLLASFSAVALALREVQRGVQSDDEEVGVAIASHNVAVAENAASSQSVMEMRAGLVLRDRYTLEERVNELQPGKAFPKIARHKYEGQIEHLGTGSFGDTWQAYDAKLGKKVAVKIFYDSEKQTYLSMASATPAQKKELGENVKECQRVKDWITAAGTSLGANHICQCYEEHITDADTTNGTSWFGTKDYYLFLVLELCGKDFDGVLQGMVKSRQVDVAKARDWAKQVLEGLVFLTSLNPPWMHHDLKPANLAITDEKELKLIDWGGALEGNASNIGAACVCTPSYSAPEQLEGKGCFSFPMHSYDVYAVGLMYMQFLCPRVQPEMWMQFDQARQAWMAKPMSESTIYTTLTKNCPALAGNVDQDVRLISRMLSRSPQNRPTPSSALNGPPWVAGAQLPQQPPTQVKPITVQKPQTRITYVQPKYVLQPQYQYAPVGGQPYIYQNYIQQPIIRGGAR